MQRLAAAAAICRFAPRTSLLIVSTSLLPASPLSPSFFAIRHIPFARSPSQPRLNPLPLELHYPALRLTADGQRSPSSRLRFTARLHLASRLARSLLSPAGDGPPSDASRNLIEALPYLLGSGGTTIFDLIIMLQSYAYRDLSPRDDAEGEGEAAKRSGEESSALITDR